MDITGIVAWGASLLLGIGVVWKFISKYSTKAKKAITVAREGLDLLDETLKAIEDGKVSEDEVKRIIEEAQALKAALAALKQ